MPNFREASVIHKQSGVPGHAAFLSFQRDDERIKPAMELGKEVRNPNFITVPQSRPRDLSNVYLLQREMISIDTEPSSAPHDVEFDVTGMVQLSRLVKDSAIDGSFLSDDFDPMPNRGSAFIDVTIGDLEPVKVPRILEFRPRANGQPPYVGTFAEEVIWELRPDHYVLRSRAFGVRTTVKLFEIDASEPGDIIMRAGNLPFEDLVEPDAPRLRLHDDEVIDHHFHRFYELCATAPDSHPLPHRVSARRGELRSLSDNCPPLVGERGTT